MTKIKQKNPQLIRRAMNGHQRLFGTKRQLPSTAKLSNCQSCRFTYGHEFWVANESVWSQ